MKRRGFLSLLGLGSSAVVAGVAMAMPKSVDDKGIYLPIQCGNQSCGKGWQIFVNLTKPIAIGTPQCPRCLSVMPFPDDAAQRIKAWNVERGFKTTIHTPRHG